MKADQVGDLLRKRRGSMGLRAAAREIGISPTTLSRIENGHIPDLGTLEKICAWLGEELESFTSLGELQIAFKKDQAIAPKTNKSLAKLIELANKQFIEKIATEGH